MPITDADILQYFLAAAPDFASGADLARQHGISRAAVYERLKKLRGEGFEFKGTPRRGYRLIKEPLGLHPALLRAYLVRHNTAMQVLYFPEIDSTNSEARRQLAAGRVSPFVVLSSRQTAGRGRMGRTWHSPDAGNAYMSFVFQPQVPPSRMQSFTLWTGVSLCRFLSRYTGLSLGIKWPNDLMLNGKKVGGILTEAHVDTDQIRELILGIGLNINCDVQNWPADLADRATSLALSSRQSVASNPLIARLIAEVNRAYKDFMQDALIDKMLAELWKEYDRLYGQPIQARCSGKLVSGIADGIDRQGALRLQLPDQSYKLLYAGDVSLVAW